MVRNANKEFMDMVLTNAFKLDLRPTLSAVAASILIVRGELDASRTPAHVQELLAGIPNSRAAEIAGAGHSVQMDSPQAFTTLIRRFLMYQ